MTELLKEALETIKSLKTYFKSDDPGLEIGAPVIKKLEEAIENGTWKGLSNREATNAAVYVFCHYASSPEEQEQIKRDLIIACNEPNSALMFFAATIEALLEDKNK